MSGGCRLEQMGHENERQRRTGGRDGEQLMQKKKRERERDVEWGNKREEDRDDMPEVDSSADLEVNPISEIAVCGSYVMGQGVDMGTDTKQERMTDLCSIRDGFISSSYYVLRINNRRFWVHSPL